MPNRLLGIWDLEKSPLFLGGLLTLIEELKLKSFEYKLNDFDICTVGDIKKDKNKNIIQIVNGLEGLKKIFYFPKKKDLDGFLSKNLYIVWPDINYLQADYNYGTTKWVQKFYRQYKFIPYLKVKKEVLNKVNIFLKKWVYPRLPITVHLKYNPECKDCSNADFSEWYHFFHEVLNKNKKLIFILVGDDKIDKQITELDNILMAKNLGSNLAVDLGLVENSFLFMGMASGICNMAIFSDVPYIIFKDPSHHREKMLKEMGKSDQFIFANRNQKLLRVNHTAQILFSEFNSLYEKLRVNKWRKKYN